MKLGVVYTYVDTDYNARTRIIFLSECEGSMAIADSLRGNGCSLVQPEDMANIVKKIQDKAVPAQVVDFNIIEQVKLAAEKVRRTGGMFISAFREHVKELKVNLNLE